MKRVVAIVLLALPFLVALAPTAAGPTRVICAALSRAAASLSSAW